MQYEITVDKRIKFIVKMHYELKQNQLDNISNKELRVVVNDIHRYP